MSVPSSTFQVDEITNSSATEVASVYCACQRTNFRIKVSEGLISEWDNTLVRPESYTRRHPQQFVRVRAEELEGAERPEPEDQFISDSIAPESL